MEKYNLILLYKYKLILKEYLISKKKYIKFLLCLYPGLRARKAW
jgi:hypothetical protein